MNHTAIIDYNRKEGYVVCWTEGYELQPLRNFGDWKSAAIEFRDYINHSTGDSLPKQIAHWRKTYDPNTLYAYPHKTSLGMIITPKQKQQER